MKTTSTPVFLAQRRRKETSTAAAVVTALAFSITRLVAQEGTNAVPTATAAQGTNAVPTVEPAKAPAPPAYRPWTVGLEAGTDGIIGGFGAWRFSDHLGLRLGADYAETSINHLSISGLHYDSTLRLLSEPLVLDVYPWKQHSFHVGVGILFNQNELTGTASDPHFGTLTMKLEQQPVDPYLTIGGNFFYFDHAHRWGLGGELGVAYTGDVRVSGGHHEADLRHYGQNYAWWPVAKLMVTFSF